MRTGVPLSKFYKSFSGTDTIAFLLFPGINPIVIGSLTTVSYSMYRNKVPVINIGRTNINGITRGSRIYAGTMVFTLINKHWLRELQDQASYLKDFPTLKTDELPLFDIMIVSANEYGSSCTMFIYGVDFTDEAQTLSVEDLFTENVFKFVAREVAVFDEVIIKASENQKKFYTVSTGVLKNYFTEEDTRQADIIHTEAEIRPLNRTLYLITNGENMMGNDVAAVQQLLNLALEREIPITYKFDRLTDSAVRDFQTTQGLIVDGIVDNNVYSKLLQYTKNGSNNDFVQIINKAGALVYKSPDTNSVVTQTLPYLSAVEVFGKITNNVETYYQTQNGYLSLYDTYNYLDSNNSYTFEVLQYGDKSSQVTILQNMLITLYPNYKEEVGVYGEETEKYIRLFQNQQNIVETGIVDNYTWNILLEETDTSLKSYFTNHTEVTPSKEPGVYTTTGDYGYLSDFTVTINNHNEQQTKYSAIAIYSDGHTKTMSKTYTHEGSETHSVNEFSNLFKDDSKYLTPTDVYYIVYPYGSIPYKWHFKIKG